MAAIDLVQWPFIVLKKLKVFSDPKRLDIVCDWAYSTNNGFKLVVIFFGDGVRVLKDLVSVNVK